MPLCLRGATFSPRCAPGKIALRRTPSSRRSSTTIPAGSASWRRRKACVEVHGRRILISSTNTCARVVRRAIVHVDASPLQSCSGLGQHLLFFKQGGRMQIALLVFGKCVAKRLQSQLGLLLHCTCLTFDKHFYYCTARCALRNYCDAVAPRVGSLAWPRHGCSRLGGQPIGRLEHQALVFQPSRLAQGNLDATSTTVRPCPTASSHRRRDEGATTCPARAFRV